MEIQEICLDHNQRPLASGKIDELSIETQTVDRAKALNHSGNKGKEQ